jgi:hypothetical protein
MNLRFRKEKAYFRNTFWTAGSILKIFRDSLTKTPAEPVTSNPGVRCEIRRLTATAGGDAGERIADGERTRRRHSRSTQYLASGHHSTNRKYREKERSTAISPHAKTEPRMNRGRRAAWRGGRWRRDRVSSLWWCHGSVTDAAKGMDEGGYARHPWFYSPEAL